MPEKLLKVDEVCRLLDLRPWAVYGLIARGELPAIRVGRNVRVSPTALRAKFGNDVLPLREPGKRTQNMFLPTFMNVILWRRFKSQAPDWSDEQCEREAEELMTTFDSVNAQYAHTRLDAPKDERDLAEALVYQFGRRVIAATGLDPADPQALQTCMSSMRGIMRDMQPTQYFGRIVQVR